MYCCTPQHVKGLLHGHGLAGVRNVATARETPTNILSQTPRYAYPERSPDQTGLPKQPSRCIPATTAPSLITAIMYPRFSQIQRRIYKSMASISVTRRDLTRLTARRTINLFTIDIACRVDCTPEPPEKTAENAHAETISQDDTTSDFQELYFNLLV